MNSNRVLRVLTLILTWIEPTLLVSTAVASKMYLVYHHQKQATMIDDDDDERQTRDFLILSLRINHPPLNRTSHADCSGS